MDTGQESGLEQHFHRPNHRCVYQRHDLHDFQLEEDRRLEVRIEGIEGTGPQASSPPRPPPAMPPLYEGTEWRTSYNPDDRSLTTIERRPSISALGFLVMIVMADMRQGSRLPWLTHIQTEPDEETGEEIRTMRWVRSSDFLSQPPEVQEQSMSALQVINIVWRVIQGKFL
ncbi:unnamed protein product [Bemisia tabaci]|uniref:Uncharacterized protein n=1 Tax=Bemisia tabaci TaxID=7038 RepID=A0A9P0APM8_BEMTA|nr:unnamed protein product [Bemisia tabaci]